MTYSNNIETQPKIHKDFRNNDIDDFNKLDDSNHAENDEDNNMSSPDEEDEVIKDKSLDSVVMSDNEED